MRRVTLLITASCSEPSLMIAQGCANCIEVCVIGEKQKKPQQNPKNTTKHLKPPNHQQNPPHTVETVSDLIYY